MALVATTLVNESASEPALGLVLLAKGLKKIKLLSKGLIKGKVIGAALASSSNGGNGRRNGGGQRRGGGRGAGRRGPQRNSGQWPSMGRRGRSITDEQEFENIFLEASILDTDDCAKSFVCQLNAKPLEELSEFEEVMRNMYAPKNVIDVTKDTVELDLASMIGRKAGEERCQTIYQNCQLGYETMKKVAGL